MYAVVRSGGKQYKVKEGQSFSVELLEVQPGEVVKLDQVLLVEDDSGEVHIGKPFLNSAEVTAQVVEHARDKKIRIIKMRRRKHYRRTQGHRQHYTELKIEKIAI